MIEPIMRGPLTGGALTIPTNTSSETSADIVPRRVYE